MDGYLSSKHRWHGRFWLPGVHDQDQRGILSYTPDKGVQITLIGGFDHAVWLPTAAPPSTEWDVVGLLHGIDIGVVVGVGRRSWCPHEQRGEGSDPSKQSVGERCGKVERNTKPR
jgi:hypothetical protein